MLSNCNSKCKNEERDPIKALPYQLFDSIWILAQRMNTSIKYRRTGVLSLKERWIGICWYKWIQAGIRGENKGETWKFTPTAHRNQMALHNKLKGIILSRKDVEWMPLEFSKIRSRSSGLSMNQLSKIEARQATNLSPNRPSDLSGIKIFYVHLNPPQVKTTKLLWILIISLHLGFRLGWVLTHKT